MDYMFWNTYFVIEKILMMPEAKIVGFLLVGFAIVGYYLYYKMQAREKRLRKWRDAGIAKNPGKADLYMCLYHIELEENDEAQKYLGAYLKDKTDEYLNDDEEK